MLKISAYSSQCLVYSINADIFSTNRNHCTYNNSCYFYIMSLEQDIKQEKFTNEFEKAAVNILFTSSWLHHLNASRFKSFDITPEQFNVLRILRGSHPKAMKLSDITSRMIDKNSNCTRLVEKLRQKGLADREICEGNRRQVDISITSSGLNVLKKIDEEENEWIATLQNISQAEAQELNRILDKLRG